MKRCHTGSRSLFIGLFAVYMLVFTVGCSKESINRPAVTLPVSAAASVMPVSNESPVAQATAKPAASAPQIFPALSSEPAVETPAPTALRVSDYSIAAAESDHSGRVTRALVNDYWVYIDLEIKGPVFFQIYSIPLDAPEGTQPLLLWQESGFPFFLVWGDDIFIFANPQTETPPMRGILIDVTDGSYSVFDMRQSQFYYPTWTDGSLAYGYGDNDVRSLNRDTDQTERVRKGLDMLGFSKDYIFSGSEIYSISNPLGEPLSTVEYDRFLCSVGDGALLQIENGKLALLKDDVIYVLFEKYSGMNHRPSDNFLYCASHNDSYTPDCAILQLTGTDALGNKYDGLVYIGPDGVMSIDESLLTNRPASSDGKAVFYTGSAETLRPIEGYPQFEFFIEAE